MSLMKKDPSLRVAANEPHFVSLGGGRLSTAVTIHNIPIGDMTIGSSTTCSISLNGTGVRPIHCTIYRSEENEVTIVPERDARILIDGTKITQETNLTQGAMITIGNSNYLRFNNPAEAQMMRSAMGSNERISMPQIDFTQVSPQHNSDTIVLKDATGNPSNGDLLQSMDIESFYESTINPTNSPMTMLLMDKVNETGTNKGYKNLPPIDINGLQCPKVFTADLVTVNMPAKDVLGQKYANFAKNLAENHRVDKNITNTLKNNQCPNNSRGSGSGIYVNIPSTSGFIQNTNVAPPNSMNSGSTEYLTKVNNTTPLRALNSNNHHNINAYDRYPKPGTYGGLQIFPMNGVNTEINNGSPANTLQRSVESSARQNLSNISNSETERLEDMLKICTEYADRQNQSNSSITSSPIVQNRIKTNGSLPRDKKSPFYHELSGSLTQQCNGIGGSSENGSVSSSSGYENVRLVGQNRVEINGQAVTGNAASPKSGYENVVIGKYVPQSPRTKIRTICMSPKKEHSFSNAFNHAQPQQSGRPPSKPQLLPKPTLTQQSEYDQLIKTFEEKLKLEMQAIEASSRYQPNSSEIASAGQSPAKRSKKNINNLTLNLYQSNSLQNSPKLSKKPAPAPRSIAKKDSNGSVPGLSGLAIASSSAAQREEGLPKHQVIENGGDDVDQLKRTRKELLHRIQRLKTEISDLQKQEDETLRELHLEKALVSAELSAVGDSVGQYEKELQLLQQKVHRMEAQRNSTRVMEENQQAKLKQSIEMKQDQVKKLKALLKQKSNNDCLKEELHNVAESLENDRKTFEDLEFQYLEEESEWHAYREELHTEEKGLTLKIEEKRMEMQHLERQELTNQNSASSDAKTLKTKLLVLLNSLQSCQAHLKTLDTNICDLTGQLHIHSSDEEDSVDDKLSTSTASPPMQGNLGSGMMSQSLFGSAELLCPKRSNVEDIMSKSVNENMFYNNKIELPIAQAASTPKRPQMQLVDIKDADLLDGGKNHQLKAISIRSDQNTNELDEQSAVMAQNDRVKFNLSLDSDDFEVNPLERRVPSQDDIDRISKLTLDAPISTKGASTKIFDSIKEIERNRQLLLAQQGHHVIEHERQKMNDLKKKSHDEARAQYLSMLSNSVDGSSKSSPTAATVGGSQRKALEMDDCRAATKSESLNSSTEANQRSATDCRNSRTDANPPESEHRHSQPEYESQHREQQRLQHQLQHQNSSRSSPRPLSDANSELSCDLLAENIAISSTEATCKSILELSTTAHAVNRYSAEQNTSGDDTATTKRSSLNSNDTNSGGSGCNERKRMLPKHQRPLTRYLPIFSPDLNLRHHIESAGHQIAVCPHVFVDAYSCRGYLHKLGATFHGWARRWFVLDRQRSAFIYYADKSERKPRGGAYFSTIDEVYLDHLNASKSGRPHCTLIVKTKKRSYHLQAASDAAARIWIDAIITGAQGNLDY